MQKFDKHIKDKDLIIVNDFGHGMITKKIAKYLTAKAKFLAVNAQVNAANIGFQY